MAMDFLFLNLRTILLYTLTTKTVFLQTATNSSHQLQEMQTTCQAQTPPIIRSQMASSMPSSGISNFQKMRQNFWHQIYSSGIYYTTPWKWRRFAPETTNSNNSLKPYVISSTAKKLMVWRMPCIWGTVLSSGDYSLMLQRQVLKQSSYTMEISCLSFLWHMLPAQKKRKQQWKTFII